MSDQGGGSRRVVLLGAPGAGKGTQAEAVSGQAALEHLSTGDLLRAAVKAGTPTGLEAKASMDAGRLVSDELVLGVLFDRLDAGVPAFLLDGFPRTLPQAEALDRRLAERGTPLDRVVEIHVPDERLAARLTGRRVCGSCGRNHHVEFLPPRQEGVCDTCGGGLVHRSDDRIEVVGERLAVYHRQTAPLRDYYGSRGLLETVDGDRDVGLITRDLLETLAAPVARRS
ncbi:MAG: adenylate kinase [Planctomycetota bacterium]|jgi:adenylate kinase